MQQTRARAAASVQQNEPNWYRIYYLAVLEGDRYKAKIKIDRAQHAIQDRLIELRSESPSTPRESQDLCNALLYLSLLLQHMTADAGGVLWD